MFEKILVVCVGNICRSPMAEALLIETLKNEKKINYHISSAGINAMVGYPPDEIALELMLEKGIDISNYLAKQINQTMIRKSDLILVMEQGHKEHIENKEPSAKGKVFRLGEWEKLDIADPYRQERKVFKEAMQIIERSVMEWVKRI